MTELGAKGKLCTIPRITLYCSATRKNGDKLNTLSYYSTQKRVQRSGIPKCKRILTLCICSEQVPKVDDQLDEEMSKRVSDGELGVWVKMVSLVTF